MQLLLILLALLSFKKITRAQALPGAYTITGSVIDSISQKKLDFMTVNLLTGKDTVVKVSYSKSDGSFLFTDLQALTYTVMVIGVGYKTTTVAAAFAETSPKTLDLGTIRLSQETLGLKEVTVTAAKPVIRQEIDRISYDLQADPESKVFSVLDMMRKVPFLSLDAEDNILLKGNAGFRILINGKPSSMVERNYKDILRSMPASSIQRIEVITTPPAKYDAEGLAGIINIITNKKVDNGYNGSVNISERFPVGGPGIGGSFSAKLGKWGMSGFAGGSLYNTPETRNTTRRITSGADPTNLDQHGNRESDSRSGYIGYEVSYEFDSLNLISGQLNVNGNRSKGTEGQFSVLTGEGGVLQQYRLANSNNGNGQGMDAALNYQRGFKADKNRLLTFSYRYFMFGNEQNTALTLSDRMHYPLPDYQQMNNQHFSEQTFQVDYVYPVKQLNIEAGFKGIFRENKSDFQHRAYAAETGLFESYPDLSNKFSNTQNVYGVYNTYQYTVKNWGIKAGVRVEQTVINADFISTDSRVRQNYFNAIPSVSLNRKLKENSALNLGFSQRIQRPGIYQLNPFIDRSNPSFERTGNPNLHPSSGNEIQLSYNRSQKGSFNFSIGTVLFKDLIFPISVYDPVSAITRISYGNTGRARLLMSNLNINYPITKKWTSGINARVAHGKVRALVNGVMVANRGLMYGVHASTGYRFEKGWRISANLNANGPNVNLQSTSNTMLGSSFSVNKDVFKDKLSFSAAFNNPFTKFRKDHRETFGPDFTQDNDRWDYFRSFHASVNYKFGKLKEAIRKNKRGIRNDDVQNGS